MKLSERTKLLELSPMRKFHPYELQAVAKGHKIYHLNIGQPDIVTPPVYFETIRKFSEPVLEYAASPGRADLVDSIRRYYARMGVQYEHDDVYITAGGSEALAMTMMCILDPGSEVLVPEPYYPNYHSFVTCAGGVIRPIPTTAEEGYHFATRERIEAGIHENTRAILVTNPSNPTGVVLTRAEQQLIMDIATEHDLYVIADEVYREFVYNGEDLMSFAQLDDPDHRIIVIDSISKRFSACGARIGILCSKNRLFMDEALKFCQSRLAVATVAQNAAASLYDLDKDYFNVVREEYKLRRDTVVQKLRQIPGVICAEPQGAFYLMAALPIDNADRFQQWLLTDFEDHGETVMFAPGASFYATPGRGVNEVRIAYILKQEDLERAMDLLALGIEQYNQRNK